MNKSELVAAIANDGMWITPHVIKYSPEEEAVKIKKVQVMTPEHARIITELLTESVNQGKSIIPFSDQLIGILNNTVHLDRGPGHPSTLLYVH